MIYVQIKGGLGNQLFQYAVGYFVSKANQETICLDCSSTKVGNIIKHLGLKKSYSFRDVELESFSLDKHFVVSSVFSFVINYIIGKVKPGYGFSGGKICRSIKEEGVECREDHSDKLRLSDREQNLILSGYWQNMHYIEPIKDDLRRQFMLTISTGERYNNARKSIEGCISVGVHVRRGDFVSLGWDKGEDYYINAMNYIRDVIPNARFYIFSDDPSWAKDHVLDSRDCELIVLDEDHSAVKEFDLLKSCKHQIISESTFGWWAAFLNYNAEKIVCIPFDCKGDIWADVWKRIEYKK